MFGYVFNVHQFVLVWKHANNHETLLRLMGTL